jgi:RimJ/RimL family protein N-acetyltransferase
MSLFRRAWGWPLSGAAPQRPDVVNSHSCYTFAMNITFRPTNYASELDCEAIARWQNDPELQRLWVPNRGEKTEIPRVTADQVARRAEQVGPFVPAADELAILNDRIVGQLTVIINPPHRKSTAATVAWPSLIIGEPSLRGSGIVRRFGDRIMAVAKSLRASEIEAGVFEFNEPIRRLLSKAQFEEFARVENMTVRDGRNWADVRYRRPL